MSRRAHLLRDRPRAFHLDPSHGLSKGLVAAYLGGGAGETRYWDSGPQRLHGTLQGFVGAGNTPVDRWSRANGRATLGFNGSADYVLGSTSVAICPPQLSVSVRTNQTSVVGGIAVAKGVVGSDGWYMWCPRSSSNRLQAAVYDGTTALTTNSGVAPVAGMWAQSGFSYSAQYVLQGYFNGLPDGSPGSGAAAVRAGATPLTVGTYNGGAIWYAGQVADVLIWSRALSPKEWAVIGSPDPLYDGWIVPDVARRYFVPSASSAKPWLWTRRNQLIGGGTL